MCLVFFKLATMDEIIEWSNLQVDKKVKKINK